MGEIIVKVKRAESHTIKNVDGHVIESPRGGHSIEVVRLGEGRPRRLLVLRAESHNAGQQVISQMREANWEGVREDPILILRPGQEFEVYEVEQ